MKQWMSDNISILFASFLITVIIVLIPITCSSFTNKQVDQRKLAYYGWCKLNKVDTLTISFPEWKAMKNEGILPRK